MTDQARDVWGSTVPVDVLGSSDPAGRPGSAGGTVIGVLALVIAIVAGTGIFAAAQLSGGGPQPEDVLPGTAFAFAKVDLDPPAGQKLAIRELASKFPKAPAKDTEGLRDEAIRSMLEDGDVELSYETDVKPWLGRRAGIAGFVLPDGEAAGVVAIQTKDRAKTEQAIRKAGAQAAVEFRRGYALLAESHAVLDAALAATESRGPLGERDSFRADVEAIGEDHVALAWTDNAGLADTMQGSPAAAELRGRSVFSLSAARTHVELATLSIGTGTTVKGGGTDTLRRLPGDTVAGLLVHDASGLADQAVKTLGATAFVGQSLLYFPYLYGIGGGGTLHCDVIPSSDVLAPAQFEEDPCVEAEAEPERTPYGGDYESGAKSFERGVLPLLKDEATLALGSVPKDAQSRFELGLVARVNGPGNALAPFAQMLEALGVKVSPQVSGDLVYAATEAGYLDRLARGGDLGAQELFRTAMGDLGSSVVGALYVNVDAIEKAVPEYPDAMRPVDAVGIVMSSEGDRVSSRLRIVVR